MDISSVKMFKLLISYRKGNRLKTCLSKQNYKGFYQHNGHTAGVVQVCQPHFNSHRVIESSSHRVIESLSH